MAFASISSPSAKWVILCALMPILFAVLLPLGFTASEASLPSITTRIISTDPLIIHIANFITGPEIEHLLRLGEDNFTDSMVVHENGSEIVDQERTSSTAFLPGKDSVVERVTARASEFQGYTSMKQHESLQLTRYRAGQQYKPHWDWFPVPERQIVQGVVQDSQSWASIGQKKTYGGALSLIVKIKEVSPLNQYQEMLYSGGTFALEAKGMNELFTQGYLQKRELKLD
ncbi:hypothetical protein FB567DRAFT_547729 [Paraphoma chrysanthemicola]|uniref:Prolyl 4-hydroxylase alpha subunit domain-containing protein n=1 Tax=Paraphoma chrysanthemicola TaxID=798071 RepID=A0A8K0R7Q7_9PLEO|nr:hypothetical protein FB567DRAFT_547729 [Paraphoma chrysanthemicola]